VQSKLLRVIQEREFERVGGSQSIKADVRVIAATNRDLATAVRDGSFRQDLYYRLSVFPIQLPPLRERREDIPLLVQFLIDKFRMQIGKPIEGVTSQTMDRFLRYGWPGNVRELENVIERAVIVGKSSILDVEPAVGLSPAFGRSDGPEAGSPTLEELERQHIRKALDQTGWVIDGPRGAARILGIHPNTLRSRLKRLGIEREVSSKPGL
jgi:formate hydrogenlyase transcriptional activator